MARNPLRTGRQPQEATPAEAVTNLATQRRLRIQGPDGQPREVPLSTRLSAPNEHGVYVDSEVIELAVDASGTVINQDSPIQAVAISHSGLVVPTVEHGALCTSPYHHGPIRWILLGVDGRRLPNGQAICSPCDSIRRTVRVLLGLLALGLGLGVAFGLYRFFGWF